MALKRIYLDNSATTRVRKEVIKAMLPFFNKKYGNPSSLHSMGQEAWMAVQNSRKQVAEIIGAEADEIIFTSSGTESDNLALFGIAYANKNKGRHIITSQIEHPAILQTCKFLEGEGFEVTYVSVDHNGLIDPAEVKAAIKKEETILISIMSVNTELGTIQPIGEIGKIAKTHNIYFHTDAVGCIGQKKIDVNEFGIDLLSMDGHKIHAPKGIGALYVKKSINFKPPILGGSQERGLRSGTENVPGIVGMGKACEITLRTLEEDINYMTGLRDRLIDGILRMKDVYLNGHRTIRAPNNVNVRFNDIDGESLLLSLNEAGIEVSIGCACLSKDLNDWETAYKVLLECGLSKEEAKGSIRMTISTLNSEEEINRVLETLPNIVEKLRSESPLYKTK